MSEQLREKLLLVNSKIPLVLHSVLFYSEIMKRNIDSSATSILNVEGGKGRIMQLLNGKVSGKLACSAAPPSKQM